MPQVRLSDSRKAFLIMLSALTAFLLIPFSALASSEEKDLSSETGATCNPYFLDTEEQVQVTDEGMGWKLMTVNAPASASASTKSGPEEILAVWPGGLKGAPLSAAMKQELENDFGYTHPPRGFQIKSTEVIVINKTLVEAMENGDDLSPWLPYAEPDSNADSGPSNKLGCSGWKTKTKTQDWGFDESNFSDDFTLGSNITGNYEIDIPMQGQATLELTYSYKRNWLCIPYEFRFDQARMHGDLNITGDSLLNASVSAQGHWEGEKRLANPRIGKLEFWVGVIPVVINFHLPVDVGYTIDAQAEATLSVGSDLNSAGTFDYTCNRDTCWGSSDFYNPLDENGVTGSIEVSAQAQVWAKVKVRANLYSDSFLYAEAGVKGFVEGDFWGYYGNNCGDGDGDGINETVKALTVGADAGYDWVYGIGGIINDKEWTSEGNRYYLGWWDLLGEGGSTALSPMIEGPSQVNIGEWSEFTVKMRPCYPYTDAVTFTMDPGDWTGDMTLEDPKTSTQTTSKIFGSPQSYDLRALAVRDAKGRNLRVPQWRRIHAFYPEPPPSLLLSYTPAGGGNRITYRSDDPATQPTQLFYYDSNQGNFEQRPGGACSNGSNNPTYVKLSYDGPPMTACTFQSQLTSGPINCSQTLVDLLNNGNELTINTDTLAIDPGTCHLAYPVSRVCGSGDYCWVLLDMEIEGETVRRSVAFRQY